MSFQQNLHRLAAFALICAASPILGAEPAPSETAHAIPFTAIKPANEPDHGWRKPVCAVAPQACSPTAHGDGLDPVLYHAANDPANRFYAIATGPHLLQLAYRPDSHQWAILADWDFGDFTPSRNVQGDAENPPLEIYPALYPLGPRRDAVAVLSSWSEAYSGGGGSWSYADFVELKPAGQYAKAPSVAGVPFSCAKSIRACFSEQDYKTSPHCSEDSNGTLHLKFVNSADTPNAYDWIATWKETLWPGLKPQRSTTTAVKTVRLRTTAGHADDAKTLDQAVSFCEPINR
jgi:hypothetical protein